MAAKNTAARSSSTAPAVITENPLAESKSTSEAQRRGLHCERVVFLHLRKKGYRLLRHRYRSPFGEIDLMLRSPIGELCLVEVKSLRTWTYFSARVKPTQKKRLRRVLIWASEREPSCRLMLAVVGPQDEVLVFEDVFG